VSNDTNTNTTPTTTTQATPEAVSTETVAKGIVKGWLYIVGILFAVGVVVGIIYAIGSGIGNNASTGSYTQKTPAEQAQADYDDECGYRAYADVSSFASTKETGAAKVPYGNGAYDAWKQWDTAAGAKLSPIAIAEAKHRFDVLAQAHDATCKQLQAKADTLQKQATQAQDAANKKLQAELEAAAAKDGTAAATAQAQTARRQRK
jgi:hypothetical protein